MYLRFYCIFCYLMQHIDLLRLFDSSKPQHFLHLYQHPHCHQGGGGGSPFFIKLFVLWLPLYIILYVLYTHVSSMGLNLRMVAN